MNARPRLVFLSSVSVPHQVKPCYELQPFFDAEFWFYESAVNTRGKWWEVELGDKCKILERVVHFKAGPWTSKYLALGLARKLERFDPDVVMLGGFSIPSNVLAFRWARRNKKKTIVFTERSRDRHGVLRRRSLAWQLLAWLYRDLDLVITSAEDAVPQLRDELGFGGKVVAGRYAADLDAYFAHPIRHAKPAYTYLFANRMTEIYNPLGALEIFAAVLAKHPGSRLLMNAAGELGDSCRARIAQLGITSSVEFLTSIASWGELHTVYARSDILLLPAHFSNGNFTILEAMASGMGIVISDRVLGIGKLIEDGVNGFNTEPTSKSFLERIERYVEEPRLFEEHTRANRQKVVPLSTKGTANFTAGLIKSRLGY